jgi:hypothetical protein
MNDYQILAPDRYTCVAPPGFEKDPAVTKAIREFDRELIPMWRIQLWRFPDSPREVRVVHHVIGRYFPLPKYRRGAFPCPVPMEWRRPTPNFLDHVLEYTETEQHLRGGPGDYVPWDWALYRWCRFHFDKNTVEAWDRRHRARLAYIAKLQAEHVAELAYRKAQIEPYLQRKIDSVSDAEWKEYLSAVWGNPGNPEIRRRPKPMVFHGPAAGVVIGDRSPRSARTYGRVAPAQGERNAGNQEVLE